MHLGDITEPKIDQSGPPPGSEFTYIDISSVDNKIKRIVEPRRLPAAAAPSRARQRLQTGDVLVSMTRPNLNAVALVPHDLDGAIGSTGFHVLRARDNVLPQWLYYGVQSPQFIGAMSELVQGALYPAVRPKDIRAFDIPVPELDEQHRIITEIEKQFSRLDEAVANLKRVKANLTRYKAAVLKAAVEGRLVPTEAELARRQGHSYQTGAQLLARTLEDTRSQKNQSPKRYEPSGPIVRDLPPLPEGWIWASALQVCAKVVDCHNKTAPYVGAGIPLIRTANIRDGRLLLEDMRFVDLPTYTLWSRRCPPEPGDILFTREAPMGEAAIISPALRLCMGQRIMLMRPSSAINSGFLLIALVSPVVRALIDLVAVGSGVKHLRVRDAERLPVPLPPLAEQERIEREVSRRLSIVDVLSKETEDGLNRASAMKQAYLSKFFAGAYELRDATKNAAQCDMFLSIFASR